MSDYPDGLARIDPGFQLFSRHRWPVTLRHGPLMLAPMRYRDQAAWERVRRANLSWLRPWEATVPPGTTALAISAAARSGSGTKFSASPLTTTSNV